MDHNHYHHPADHHSRHDDMADTMRFAPAKFAVKQGETIRFVVKNSGEFTKAGPVGIGLAVPSMPVGAPGMDGPE